MQFLSNTENAQKLNDLVDVIREAVMDYQVRISKASVLVSSNIFFSVPCSGISTTTPVD